jgi:hypothetical protein
MRTSRARKPWPVIAGSEVVTTLLTTFSMCTTRADALSDRSPAIPIDNITTPPMMPAAPSGWLRVIWNMPAGIAKTPIRAVETVVARTAKMLGRLFNNPTFQRAWARWCFQARNT